jgi:tetratricopeptide (TPR) repeat protein
LAVQPNDTDALDNKAAALNNLGNYTGAILYYNKALAIDPKNTFALTNKHAIVHMLGNNSTYSTYENSTYGIRVQYPSDWSVQESNTTGTLIRIATFVFSSRTFGICSGLVFRIRAIITLVIQPNDCCQYQVYSLHHRSPNCH